MYVLRWQPHMLLRCTVHTQRSRTYEHFHQLVHDTCTRPSALRKQQMEWIDQHTMPCCFAAANNQQSFYKVQSSFLQSLAGIVSSSNDLCQHDATAQLPPSHDSICCHCTSAFPQASRCRSYLQHLNTRSHTHMSPSPHFISTEWLQS